MNEKIGITYASSPIDFAISFGKLQSSAQFVSQLKANGHVNIHYNSMELFAFHPNLNIFLLTPVRRSIFII